MKHFVLSLLALALCLPSFADSYSRVSVHDPSIVIGYKKDGKITGEQSAGAEKIYYIFGSHKAFAKSTDMKNWSTFSNNIQADQNDLFYHEIGWSKLGSSTYDVNGNLWAPDVIWNKDMKKWCMYMSVNGDSWYSSIALLTSDSPEGDWTHVGTVVYSIPWKAKESSVAAYTDFYSVTGIESGSTLPDRYKINGNGNQTYGTNAIDPCVFYDEGGTLWMSYGSWFGGLWMIQLDKATGLRDKTRTYEVKGGTAETAQEDPYMGIKIYGGNGKSGEASYIEYIDNKYYLFVTYGGLEARGGYNMRVFSADSPTGPYTDMAGHSSLYTTDNTTVGDTNGRIGTRLMSYYKWNWLLYAQVAQGHNSVVVDDDGKIFNVYHTRFNSGNEGHQVRVHQLFKADNGGLCSAPFEYAGETLGSKAISASDVAGWYGILVHGWGTDYANLKYVDQTTVQLKEDGTISGLYSGKWSLDGNKITISLRSGMTMQEYKGYALWQKAETRDEEVICFTVVGADQSIWGFRKYSEDKDFEDGEKPSEYNDFTVGATDNTSAYYSAFSPSLYLSGDGEIEAKFVNYTAKAGNWTNWVFVAQNEPAAQDYFALRADNWDNVTFSNEGCSSNYNWDTFQDDMDGSTVVMTGKRNGNNVSLKFDITTAGGTKYEYTYTKTTDFALMLRLFFTNEMSHQDFEYFRIKSGAGISDAVFVPEASGKTYNCFGQEVDENYHGIVIRNGKKYLQR